MQPRPDQRPVAEHGVAVGDAENLVELVADEQDRLALGLEPFDQFVEFLDFLVAERRRRFVHDDDARVDRQRPRDGDQMLRRDAEVAQLQVRVQLCPDPVQQIDRALAHRGPVDQAEATAWRMAQIDVLGHRQVVEQHGFLVDRRDAGARRRIGRGEVHRAPVQPNLARVGLVDAGQDFHHRRLACAVLADQGRHLARVKLKRHVRQGPDAGEGFRDAGQGQDGVRHGT